MLQVVTCSKVNNLIKKRKLFLPLPCDHAFLWEKKMNENSGYHNSDYSKHYAHCD